MPMNPPDRVLRIGIVREGRIVHERLIKAGEPVTVGESTRNDFVFPPTQLPGRFQLFKPRRDGSYSLRISEDMEGKLSWKDAVLPLAQLRQDEARKVGGVWELPLPPRARGKVVIDGITVLFQFVPAPPESARMAGLSFRPRLWDDDDPIFFGFLGLNSAMAMVAMIFVYTRPPLDPFAVPEIPDRFIAKLYVEPVDNEPAEPVEIVDDDAPPTPTEPTEVADRTEEPAEPAGPKKPTERRVEDALQQSSFARALGIGTTGDKNNGRTIEDHFADGGLYTDLDSFVRDGEQVVMYEDGPAMRGPRDGRILNDEDIVFDAADVDTVVMTEGPNTGPGTFTLGPPEDPTSKATSIAAVIRANSGQLKACYESERKINPSTGGRMVVWFEIAETGKVVEVSVLENGTGSNGAFEACITRRIGNWNFASEDAGAHTYPLVFTPT